MSLKNVYVYGFMIQGFGSIQGRYTYGGQLIVLRLKRGLRDIFFFIRFGHFQWPS